MKDTIVLVPGMYSPRVVMMLMAWRLRRQGFLTRTFSNRFLSKTPAQNAQRLLQQIHSVDKTTVHLLGHSLGGIVIMHLLERNSQQTESMQISVGRVVLLAAPIQGSELAQSLFIKRWFRPFLGKSVIKGVLGNAPQTLYGLDVGVISGSSRGGLSALFFKPNGTNDGVVSLSETQLHGVCDNVCIPHSHALMLFSNVSVEKCVAFFRHGRFGETN